MITTLVIVIVALALYGCAVIAAVHRNIYALLGWSAAAIAATLLAGATQQSRHDLSYAERQRIAIEFMCSPGQHWKGMSMFCGAQVLDGSARESGELP